MTSEKRLKVVSDKHREKVCFKDVYIKYKIWPKDSNAFGLQKVPLHEDSPINAVITKKFLSDFSNGSEVWVTENNIVKLLSAYEGKVKSQADVIHHVCDFSMLYRKQLLTHLDHLSLPFSMSLCLRLLR
jgi:hypothetical protein